MTRLLAVVAVLLGTLVGSSACGGSSAPSTRDAPTTAASTPPGPSVTARGGLVESLEALLRHTYGRSAVCTQAAATQRLDFVAGDCSPLAQYNPYFFTFAEPRSITPLAATGRRPGDLGNYSEPVQLDGKFVTCGGGRYLVKSAAAVSFTLICARPL
jgi:hypothetical protein